MFNTLPGFREFYPQDCAKRDYIFAQWRKSAHRFAFVEFDPPVLESLELFTEKSGEEIKSQLFEFIDKGARAVSLRPEMTPSLARMVGAQANSLRKPVKWFCIGENYRYERQQKGRLRAFYQFNADILGEESLAADAEIIALLIESLRSFGLTENEFKLRLGDRDLWLLFLQNAGIPETHTTPALSVVDKIERMRPDAFFEMMQDALKGIDLDIPSLIEKIKNFVAIKTIEEMYSVFESGAFQEQAKKRIEQWKQLLNILSDMGVGSFVSPDLGIVRGLAYYTGFVFEAFQTVGTGRALAGGGRYNNLVKKLGYPDMPAVGFGMGDVTVSDLLELVGKQKSLDISPDICAIIIDESLRGEVVKTIFNLRREGINADYPFKPMQLGKQFKYADSLGAKHAVIFAPEEFSRGNVKVKDLKSGQESEIKLSEIATHIRG